MRVTKGLIVMLVAVTAWLSIGMAQPVRTYYLRYNHRNGTVTTFENVGPYWPEQ